MTTKKASGDRRSRHCNDFAFSRKSPSFLESTCEFTLRQRNSTNSSNPTSQDLILYPSIKLVSRSSSWAANVHFKYTKYRKYMSNNQMTRVVTQANTCVCSFLLKGNITANENAVLIFLRLNNKLWNRESLSKTTRIAKRGSLIRLFLLICWGEVAL